VIYLHLDVGDLLDLKDLQNKVDSVTKDALRDLALSTHAHIVENVQNKLHSTREKYLNALSIQQVSDESWIINLDSKAMWIEEGLEPHSQVDDMLKSPKAKVSKDGHKYLVVPFEHKKGPTSQTKAQKSLTDTIKAEFKRRKIPYGKLESGADGKPKTGLLHSFDIKDRPSKMSHAPGQGKGPIGAAMQGPTGIPFLKGIKVYQKEIKTPEGKNKIIKQIMTFRVVSSKHRGTDRWWHPGLQPKNFFEEAQKWAEEELQKRILKNIEISLSSL
jgi:hypothetical protein